MKNLNKILTYATVAILCFILGTRIRGCGDVAPVLVGDTIRERIESRDTIILDRETVHDHTNTVKTLVVEYRTETDTILKLIKCDSLAVACDSLATEYRWQDSILREQIVDYGLLVGVQDSVIFDQSGTIKKLKRRNKILVGISAVLGVVAVLK